MNIERKVYSGRKQASGCEFEAVVATLGVVDHDGDVLLPGALVGQAVPVYPAHVHASVPLGKAWLEERGAEVIARGEFNLSEPGQTWCSAIKFDLDAEHGPPLQQWSFAFTIPPGGASIEERAGRTIRVLRELEVLEVSPVLRGAGIGTRTTCAGESCRSGKGAKACSCGCGGSCSVREPSNAEIVEAATAKVRERERAIHAGVEAAVKRARVEVRARKALRGIAHVTVPAPRYLVEAAERGARALGIPVPRVKLMKPAGDDERGELFDARRSSGIAHGKAAVYVREGLGAFEELVVLGHELYHVLEVLNGHAGDESAAEDYGQRFARAIHYGMTVPGPPAAGVAA